MAYQITRWEINNMLDKTGDDFIHFDVYVALNNNPEISIPIIISFDDLVGHIKPIAPAEYDYINKIRSGMHGYGPKHSKVLAVLQEEGYDLFPYLQTYITENMVEEHSEYDKRLQASPKDSLKKALALLEAYQDEMKKENIRHTNFLDQLDKTLHELTFSHYPELFEKGNDIVEAYRNHLTRTTLDFARKIDKLMHGKLQ
jgi:hypothetical protein